MFVVPLATDPIEELLIVRLQSVVEEASPADKHESPRIVGEGNCSVWINGSVLSSWWGYLI